MRSHRLILLVLLSACGRDGGGDGTAPAPAPPPAPAVTAQAAADAAVMAPPVTPDAAAAAAAPPSLTIGACAARRSAASRPVDESLGTIGTIGGVGPLPPGALPPPRPPATGVKYGELTTTAGLDKEIVRRYVRRHHNRLQYCHEKVRLVRPAVAGTMKVTYAIDPAGSPAGIKATGVDPDLDACVGNVLASIQYPKPPGGGTVQVALTLRFEVDPAAAAPVARRPATPRLDARAVTEALRGRSDALRACLPAGALGSATLELDVDRRGRITAARVDGLPDAAVADCLATAARSTPLRAGAAGTLRCPLTFGG